MSTQVIDIMYPATDCNNNIQCLYSTSVLFDCSAACIGSYFTAKVGITKLFKEGIVRKCSVKLGDNVKFAEKCIIFFI